MTTAALNSLARASSAYLRSAMHQPIQWHEWGPEAFAAAKQANKPMLLDIGAVWCHWCHVMDRESYDDPAIAAIVNEHFIAMKVDRDERPDIDSRYQAAVQAVSGQGGWPLTAFLTPDGKPFYGGTYFPPSAGYGRPSFRQVLLSIANAYKEKNGDVVEQAVMVENAIAQSESFAGKDGRVSTKIIDAIQTSAFRMFDPQHGGFGQSPKFPHPSALDLLIERYARSGKNQAELRSSGQPGAAVPIQSQSASASEDPLHNLIVITLEGMANGGVYDQLAGGFHRYSVDERWVVPHFEKMCYDNSELLKNYVHAYQATGSEFFAHIARDIIRWVDEWLSDRDRGGFYASQDADINMDDDGDYFTWTLDEARAVLTEEEAQVAALRYDINEVGEMHHNPAKNVLYVRASIGEIARRANLPGERVIDLLASATQKMYAARLLRPTPYVDKTVYVGWNALCISAYLEAARVLKLDDDRRFALRSLDRVIAHAWKPQPPSAGFAPTLPASLLHVVSYSDPQAEHREVAGLLEDYAFTSIACLDAYEATADLSYFKFAQAITDAMIARFYDATGGGFFDSEPVADGKSLGVLGTRRKPLQDSPTPAGNPMAAIALTRLHHYADEAGYRDKAEQTLETFAGVAEQFGIFAATYGIAVAHLLESPVQVVVVGDDEAAADLLAVAVKPFAFNKTTLRVAANQVEKANLPPTLAATLPNLPQLGLGKSFAVLCSGSACQPPLSAAAELRTALGNALQQKP